MGQVLGRATVEEMQGYRGDWISQAAKTFPTLSTSVAAGLSFPAVFPPWSPVVGLACGGQTGGWMDDRGWEKSTKAEQILGPF